MASKKRGRKKATKKKRGRKKTARASIALRAGSIVTRKLSPATLKKHGMKLKAIGTMGGKKAYKVVRSAKGATPKPRAAAKRSSRGPKASSRWGALGIKNSDWIRLPNGVLTLRPHPATAGMSDRERIALYRIAYRTPEGEHRTMNSTGASKAIEGFKVGREWVAKGGLRMGTILSIRPLSSTETASARADMAAWD